RSRVLRACARGQLAGLQGCDYPGIIIGVDDDDDIVVVLRRRAEHRRTADVNLLDRLLGRDPRLGDGLPEGIQVDRDQVDRGDAVFYERGPIARVSAAGEQAAVHLGMQGFHATVHHLRKTGDLLDRDDGHARLAERLGGAARRYDLPPERDQVAG